MFADCVVAIVVFFFFFNDTATTEIYTLSLHDALPIWYADWARFEMAPCQPPNEPDAMTAAQAATAVRAASLRTAAAQSADSAAVQAATPVPANRALYLWRSAEWMTYAATGLGERKFGEIHSAGIARLL